MNSTDLQHKIQFLTSNKEIIGEEDTLACIELLKAKYINQLVGKNPPSIDCIEWIKSFESSFPTEKISLSRFASYYKNIVRDRTNGACRLTDIWIGKKNYEHILRKYGLEDCKDLNLKILGCTVKIVNQEIMGNLIIGLAGSNYLYANSKDMIVFGILKED